MTEDKAVILVVDDHETNRDLLSRRLERAGYQVRLATNGREALGLLNREPIDLVLLDVMMPEMSGTEVLGHLRGQGEGREVPVIMVTARSDRQEIVQALDLGANDYVTKPIDMDVLLARIRLQLRRGLRSPAPPALTLGPGAVLDGKYRLGQPLGSGGFGVVYEALHLALERPVAIKVLHPKLLGTEGVTQRFALEGVSACRVIHPNAVAILDAGCSSGNVPYLVMELLAGETLESILKRERLLPLKRVADVIIPLCEVLSAAHAAGIVHRDVKPENILLAKTPQGEQVKVLDFGLAQFLDGNPTSHVANEGVWGTPMYMAPERVLEQPSDGRGDIYSVGVILYRSLSGYPPFGNLTVDPVKTLVKQMSQAPVSLAIRRPDLPLAIVNLVMAAIRFEPAERPDLEEIRDVLARVSTSWREGARSGVPASEALKDAPTAPVFAPNTRAIADPESGPSGS